VNAVGRLWAALAAGDAERAAQELHANVVVEWPHTGERFESRDAFLAVHLAVPGKRQVEVGRIVTQGRTVAAEATVSGDVSWAVASFYLLHDGRILHAVEYWVQTP
jgi:ketosteroid isomerase-like protein